MIFLFTKNPNLKKKKKTIFFVGGGGGGQMDRQTNWPKPIGPFNFFEIMLQCSSYGPDKLKL